MAVARANADAVVDPSDVDVNAKGIGGAVSLQVAQVVVGAVADSFDQALRPDAAEPLSVARARAQHKAYVDALGDWVPQVHTVATQDDPDCVFVEDTAVVIDHRVAVLTRPGAPSRRAETAAMMQILQQRLDMEVHTLAAPATLDGGDVLRVGGELWVGLSARTNQFGINALGAVAAQHGLRVVAFDGREGAGLHLKSCCTLADAHTLVHLAGFEEACPALFQRAAQLGLTCLAVPEAAGANVLALGDGRVLVSAAAPKTAELLEERGLAVRTVDVGEMHKADGALTCLSVRLPPAGARGVVSPRAGGSCWCT